MRIGIDLDNTLICYDFAFLSAARAKNYVSEKYIANKDDLKKEILLIHGMEAWKGLQGYVYGQGIDEAIPFPNAFECLSKLKKSGHELFVVSHKTIYGHYDDKKIALRDAAMEWLIDNEFIGENGVIDKEKIFFCSSREDKILKIISMNFDLFIDDLYEVLSDPLFPNIEKIYFSGSSNKTEYFYTLKSWYEIENFLISQYDIKNNDFFKELSYLSGINIQSYKKIKKGGNNEIFKVFSTTNGILLVKKYREDNEFKRGSSEKLAYRIFKDIASLPKCIWSPNSMDVIALNWIDGVEISQINSNHIEQSIRFIEEIKKIKVDPSVNLAKEAVIEWGDLIQHIDARILRLKQVDNLVLSHFLDMRLCPLWDHLKRELVDNLTKLSTNEISLDLKNQIYSPSDFGFHNAIEDKKGKVFFVDFEYFGRDDPVKMIVDFWWHPAMNLTKWQKEYWMSQIFKIFSDDRTFGLRVANGWAPLGLKWALIILNEFIPEMWDRRKAARGHHDIDRITILENQLQKADKILREIETNQYDWRIYG